LATLCIITKPFHTAGTFFGVLLSTEGETGGWVTVAESGELAEVTISMGVGDGMELSATA